MDIGEWSYKIYRKYSSLLKPQGHDKSGWDLHSRPLWSKLAVPGSISTIEGSAQRRDVQNLRACETQFV